MAQPSTSIRLRVSSALVLCGVAFLPWAAYWLPQPAWTEASCIGPVFSFIAYDFAAQLIFVGGVVALVSAPWFAFKRNWRTAAQAAIEFLLALGAAIVLPAY